MEFIKDEEFFGVWVKYSGFGIRISYFWMGVIVRMKELEFWEI